MKQGHNKELHLCEYKSGAASSKSKRVFSCTCSLNREEHKAIIVLTTWISKCVVDILMCVLFRFQHIRVLV